MKITNINELRWSFDWDGEDLGYDDISVIGLYSTQLKSGQVIDVYIDSSIGEVLEVFINDEDEEY